MLENVWQLADKSMAVVVLLVVMVASIKVFGTLTGRLLAHWEQLLKESQQLAATTNIVASTAQELQKNLEKLAVVSQNQFERMSALLQEQQTVLKQFNELLWELIEVLRVVNGKKKEGTN